MSDILAHASPSLPELTPAELGVFAPNRSAGVHRWVSFTEGFSARLVAEALAGADRRAYVFDPFGGTGTTPAVAAQHGFGSGYAEVNPYLREAAETKLRALTAGPGERRHASAQLAAALLEGPVAADLSSNPLVRVNESRDFVGADALAELVAWLARFDSLDSDLARRLGRIAVATSTVGVSNMKRAVDLRRRTEAERRQRRPAVSAVIRERIGHMTEDLRETPTAPGTATCVSHDARVLPADVPPIDLVVTSPPYLNGTNYFRNTKLELLLLGHISAEEDLKVHRARAVTAGINNVSRSLKPPQEFDAVERVAVKLDEVAYDRRIPAMVRAYFSDMSVVLGALHERMAPGGRLLLDIGDSRFAGVHVDTPELLGHLAVEAGWGRGETRILRARRAKDGGQLCQKLLCLFSS